MHNDREKELMQACIELARLGQGFTSPNPMVGAVVLDKDGQIVGRGYHAAYGQAHAEVGALEQAGNRSIGGTLYVNLEPCCHFGKTPPCADQVIVSGVKKVVVGMTDPNPKVAGGGMAKLRQHNIEVTAGVLERECQWLNRGFIKRIKEGLPWLCLKLATTIDGKIADRHGTSRWISGAEARAYVHELRSSYDCVLIGGATALRDNPELTVRITRQDARNPLRAVVDTRLSVDPQLKLCMTAADTPTIIFCSQKALQKNSKEFPSAVRLIGLDTMAPQLDLRDVLTCLANEGVLSVLCEGGSRIAGALLDAGLVDEVQWIIAPKILFDQQAVPAITSFREVVLSDAVQLSDVSMTPLGADMLIQGLINDSLWTD